MTHRVLGFFAAAMTFAWATCAHAVTNTIALGYGDRPSSGQLTLQIADRSEPPQTIAVGVDGRAQADLKPGATYNVTVEGTYQYSRSTQLTVGTDPATVELQTILYQAVYGSAPTLGLFNVMLRHETMAFGDADETRRRVTDRRVDPDTQFNPLRFDRRMLDRANDGNTNRAGFYLTTVDAKAGLPVPGMLLDCKCTSVSHAIGGKIGYGYVDLDTQSDLDRRQFGAHLRGGGVAGGVSYTAQIWGKPTKDDPWFGWNRLGNRVGVEWTWGHASLDRDPRNQIAQFQPPGQRAGEADDDINYGIFSVGGEMLYRINDKLFASAGVRYSSASYDLHSKNPVNVGFQVNRTLVQSYKADFLAGTVGVEGLIPLGDKAPALFWRVGGLIGGNGNWGVEARFGAAFDLLSGLR